MARLEADVAALAPRKVRYRGKPIDVPLANLKDCIRALERLASIEDSDESAPEAYVLERAVLLFIEGLAVKREQQMRRL